MPMVFRAVKPGRVSDGATFGRVSPGAPGVDWPGAADILDLGGQELRGGDCGKLLTIIDSVGGGGVTLDRPLSCRVWHRTEAEQLAKGMPCRQ
jgi:hypothetical protein